MPLSIINSIDFRTASQTHIQLIKKRIQRHHYKHNQHSAASTKCIRFYTRDKLLRAVHDLINKKDRCADQSRFALAEARSSRFQL